MEKRTRTREEPAERSESGERLGSEEWSGMNGSGEFTGEGDEAGNVKGSDRATASEAEKGNGADTPTASKAENADEWRAGTKEGREMEIGGKTGQRAPHPQKVPQYPYGRLTEELEQGNKGERPPRSRTGMLNRAVRRGKDLGDGTARRIKHIPDDIRVTVDGVKNRSRNVARRTGEYAGKYAGKAAKRPKEFVDKNIVKERAKNRTEYLLILFNFFGPFVAYGAFFLILYLTLPNSVAGRMLGSGGAYMIPWPAGDKTVLLSTAPDFRGYGRYLMAVELAVIDTLLAWFLIYNMELVKEWKRGGKWIRVIEDKSESLLLRFTWARKLAIAFIVVFVMIPFQGSGGLTASIVGKLMGLKPWKVLVSVALGSLSGCFLLAYMVDTIRGYFTIEYQIGLFVLFFGLIMFFFVYSHLKNRKMKREREGRTEG